MIGTSGWAETVFRSVPEAEYILAVIVTDRGVVRGVVDVADVAEPARGDELVVRSGVVPLSARTDQW